MDTSAAAGVDVKRLAEQYRERAQKYEHTATIYLRIIIGVLSACILIFAGADRLAGALFKTAAEREADALLQQSTMRMLRNLAAPAEQAQNPSPTPAVTPPVAAAPALPAAKPARPSVAGNAFAQVPLALPLQLAPARGRPGAQADPLALEQVRKETAVEVAQIRANADDARGWADRDIAQARAEAERDVAQAKAEAEKDVAEQGTRRAEDLNALIASSVARVGAAVIVVLLVRIFLRDRQRLILLAGFYAGLADAMEISAGNPARLKEWLPQLVPPAVVPSDDVATPIETVMQAVVELAKRSRP
ncbi:MAG: hypothetical protein JSR42_20480 [Proteobacteria bacterium]|nr:hypothetical protein [Pseudomonadota bacterium]